MSSRSSRVTSDSGRVAGPISLAVAASCLSCYELDSPVTLAVDSHAVLQRAFEARVTILAIPDMVMKFRGNAFLIY
jgi:hypothetical protein